MITAAGYVIILLALTSAGLAVFGGLRRRTFEGRHLRERARLFEEEVRLRLDVMKARHDREKAGWSGLRKLEVVRTESEADRIRSFYLKPHDDKPLPLCLPGQYLTFSLRIPGQSKPVVRCYSLSDVPDARGWYRVTIKRLGSPPDRPAASPGLVSSYFHDRVQVGDILDVYAPRGNFHLDPRSRTPVVLIGGGIGLTPLVSMLNAICSSGTPRETWFFYGVRNRGEHAMHEHLDRIRQDFEHVHIVVCYSRPTDQCIAGRDYDHRGFVDIDLLKRRLASNNYDFYICGPPPMMQAITTGLREWGVPDDNVHFEAFGPATVKGHSAAADTDAEKAVEVRFARSNKQCTWKSTDGSLLDLAEANGVPIESGCRAGNCGTCNTALKDGKVSYLTSPGAAVEAGACLTCIAVPSEPLVLDA